MSVDFHTSLVGRLNVVVSKHLRLEMGAMFAKAEGVVFTLPESCGFSKQVCCEAYKILQISQSNIINNFMLQISDRLKPTALYGAYDDQARSLSETLSQEEVDAMVEITRIAIV